jgi:hypothetical protein
MNGKKVFMVVGIIGADEIDALEGETQYTIKNLELVDPVDKSEMARGKNADNLLTYPMWRI